MSVIILVFGPSIQRETYIVKCKCTYLSPLQEIRCPYDPTYSESHIARPPGLKYHQKKG